MAALRGDVFISKLRKFRLSFAVFQYSNPYFPNISHYPLQIFHTCEKIRRSADHRCICIYYYYYYYYYYLFSYVSKVIRLLILAHLKKISWKESKFKTMKRRNVTDDGERENKKLREHAVCELSSSQESSSTQSAKEILRRRIEQKWVQQNEERFSRSQDNATLSNWASILSNLGYFCEVRSIIAACGKIHGAYCRFDHWTVKVRFIITRTFLRTAASRGIFKIFTPQASQARRYSFYRTKSWLRTSISSVV